MPCPGSGGFCGQPSSGHHQPSVTPSITPWGGARESHAPFPRERLKPGDGAGCRPPAGSHRFLRKRSVTFGPALPPHQDSRCLRGGHPAPTAQPGFGTAPALLRSSPAPQPPRPSAAGVPPGPGLGPRPPPSGGERERLGVAFGRVLLPASIHRLPLNAGASRAVSVWHRRQGDRKERVGLCGWLEPGVSETDRCRCLLCILSGVKTVLLFQFLTC